MEEQKENVNEEQQVVVPDVKTEVVKEPPKEKRVNHKPMLFAMARKTLEKIAIDAEDFIKEYNLVLEKKSSHSAAKRKIIKEIGDIINSYDEKKVYNDREIAVMCTRIVSSTLKKNPWANF